MSTKKTRQPGRHRGRAGDQQLRLLHGRPGVGRSGHRPVDRAPGSTSSTRPTATGSPRSGSGGPEGAPRQDPAGDEVRQLDGRGQERREPRVRGPRRRAEPAKAPDRPDRPVPDPPARPRHADRRDARRARRAGGGRKGARDRLLELHRRDVAGGRRRRRADGAPRFVSVQNQYSLLSARTSPMRSRRARASGSGTCPTSPLASGLLSGKYTRGEAPPEGTRLNRFGDRASAQMNDAELRQGRRARAHGRPTTATASSSSPSRGWPPSRSSPR